MSFKLPVPKDVHDLFLDLLGRPVTVSPADPVLVEALKKTLVSVYTTNSRQLAAVIGMDLPLAVYAGSAIGLLPPGGAQDSVADGVVSATVAENVREVCSVMATLLNRPGGGHCLLHQVFLPGQEPPTDVVGTLLAIGRRIDLSLEIGGYGKGKLSITLAP
jgi:hypothetical protein